MNANDQDFLHRGAAKRFSNLFASLRTDAKILGAPFLPNWHLDAIAYQLERVRRGEVTRVILNLPPRSLKSIMVSVAFPGFLLGHNPRRKIFGISYSNGPRCKARQRFSLDCAIQMVWPNLSLHAHRAIGRFGRLHHRPRLSKSSISLCHADRSWW